MGRYCRLMAFCCTTNKCLGNMITTHMTARRDEERTAADNRKNGGAVVPKTKDESILHGEHGATLGNKGKREREKKKENAKRERTLVYCTRDNELTKHVC